MSVNINVLKEIHRNHKQETYVKLKKKRDRCEYVFTKKGTLRAHFNRNHKELEERTLECDSCDNTCTKKDTLRMHKGVKHKAKLSNCDDCDFSCTKNKVPVMHKFKKHGGQEPPRRLCELCDCTGQTTGGRRFHQNTEQ